MGKSRVHQQAPDRFAAGPDSSGIDRHDLYQQAVQHPPGDISWMTKFYRKYVGVKAPCHLREDFCGTALLCSTWCKQDVCRTATGVDIDEEVLQWAMQHNVNDCSQRICLLQADVLQWPSGAKVVHPLQQLQQTTALSLSSLGITQDSGCCNDTAADAHNQQLNQEHDFQYCPASPSADGSSDAPHAEDLSCKPCDIICAFNFSVCLLHKRSDVLKYFKNVRKALCHDPGGLFVFDLMGGHSVETVGDFKRMHFKTGIRYVFEQERYNPLTRHIRCHITLKDPKTKRVLRRAFTYNWRLWGVADLVELLKEAGFKGVHVWVKPIQGNAMSDNKHSSNGSQQQSEKEDSEGSDDSEEDDVEDSEAGKAPYLEYNSNTASTAFLNELAGGWTAYLVAVSSSD